MHPLHSPVVERRNLAIVLSGVVLVGFISVLLGKIYFSQLDLNQSALEQIKLDSERQADAVGYFFSERRDDVRDLLDSREISTFFANQALGMSMDYGLRASLLAIVNRFERLWAAKRIDETAIYHRIVFMDPDGKVLVNVSADDEAKHVEADWQALLSPEEPDPVVIPWNVGGRLRLLVSAPFFFKGQYVGQIITCIADRHAYERLVHDARDATGRYARVVPHTSLAGLLDFHGLGLPYSVLGDTGELRLGETRQVNALGTDGSHTSMMATRVQIDGTPLSLMTLVPAIEVVGAVTPNQTILAAGSLACIILCVVVVALRENTRNIVLGARFDEANKQRSELEDKNAALRHEIQKRQQVESDLREQRGFLHSLISHIPVLVFWKNRQSVYLGCNNRFAEFVGLDGASTIVGKCDQDLRWGKALDTWVSQNDQVLRTGRALEDTETELSTPGGGVRIYQVSRVPLRGHDGDVTGLVGIATDITERKLVQKGLVQARDAAEAASRAKSEFLATMSHEIRTPMNGVLGMLELVKDSPLRSAQKEQVDIAYESAQNLLAIINDILDFSKIEAGKLELEHIDFDPSLVVEDTVALLAARADEKGLELGLRIVGSIPGRVTGDPTRLRQILTNLIGNALKFTAQGEVAVSAETVTLSDTGVQLRFTVRDTGIGIAPEVQQKIFESFSQADSSSTRHFGGTGLGLSISKSLVERMAGTLQVESTLGQGSVFSFTAHFEQATSPQRLDKGLAGCRALIVDDNGTNREILRNYLSFWQIANVAAETAEQALSVLQEPVAEGAFFDVALIDFKMPGMNGIELAKLMWADARTRGLPIILLSSVGGCVTPEEDTGIVRCVTKPIRRSVLYEALCDAIDSTQSQHSAIVESSVREPPPLVLSKGTHRVLLVEDNYANQLVAKAHLRTFGLSVDVANDGLQAVHATEREHYDLVLMDVHMPELDGLGATRRIRAREKARGARRVPIAAITANAMHEDREEALAAGMDDYLAKPFSNRELARVLERCLLSDDSQPSPEALRS